MQYSDYGLTDDQKALQRGIRELCARFPDSYWRGLDADHGYAEGFVTALTEGGYLAAMIPEEFGGLGLGGSLSLVMMSSSHCRGSLRSSNVRSSRLPAVFGAICETMENTPLAARALTSTAKSTGNSPAFRPGLAVSPTSIPSFGSLPFPVASCSGSQDSFVCNNTIRASGNLA